MNADPLGGANVYPVAWCGHLGCAHACAPMTSRTGAMMAHRLSISTFISPHWVTHCVVGMQVCGAELLVDSEMPCRYKKARLNRGYGSYQDRPHP